MVPTIVVSIVATNFSTLNTLFQFIFIIYLQFYKTTSLFFDHELHEFHELFFLTTDFSDFTDFLLRVA